MDFPGVKKKWPLLCGTLLVVALSSVAWWSSSIRTPYVYSIQAEFVHLPGDDGDLHDWLKSQPGVLPHTVEVARLGARGTTLRIRLVQLQSLSGHPGFPDLDGACRQLGYGLPIIGFHDVRPDA